MYVWLHTSSPPQHVAMVQEGEVSTSAKLADYIACTNERRLTNFKWAGIFEDPRGEVSLHLFWDAEKARTYVERNSLSGRADLILASEELVAANETAEA